MATKKAPTQTQIRAAFLTLASVNTFQIGDTVKVVRGYEDNEMGCEVYDSRYLEESGFIGKEVPVTRTGDTGEYELDDDCHAPFFCLKLIRKSALIKLNDEYAAEISKDGKVVEVGCQTIMADVVLMLAEKIKAVQAAQAKPVVKKKSAKRLL